ncbi:LLM class flavin-dependent oxidoreductase [Pseudonocardia benzenivorans]|jgi:alkanesulfonate monooxygenase SsuD/methylene tetrahydromethanopterin reductase-like flavin-dependent oxidoreductase (luciferase family)|uniref:Luciferase-like, subgroup n=2 Tax=Pseudonocardia TaxID=1847 RepID=F4CVS7_PSEUX|nr:LLM class flavin-dependent oxidoreductase [Pseudonocardia dioxanivorans]AEA25412.1 Luciferase-like, subgroup [Pseudonocardia dioxanivorans CB1190]GJF02382.1 luciferase [Pseudonocardia sp. D17]
MKIGVHLYFQNYADWDRFKSRRPGPPAVTDQQIYEEDLHLAGLVEPLGFDSYWAVDHHFSPYAMTGGALQHLTYMAGKTSRLEFGSIVVVLPWYDPLAVVDQISVLDNMLQGRQLTIGLGRGAAKHEFDRFRVPMKDARGRFAESLEILRRALTNEWFSFEGEYFQIPETSIRPGFRNPERLLERMRIAWQSPETLPIVANSGNGVIMTNTKSWDEYAEDIQQVNKIRRTNGLEPTQPSVQVMLACFETEEEAWAVMSKHMLESYNSSAKQYGLDDPSQFIGVKGYEHYATVPPYLGPGTDPAKDAQMLEFAARPQAWGTPDQVVEKLRFIQQKTGAVEFIVNPRFGGMSAETAERSMRLFAAEVLPRMHALDAPLPENLRGE